MIDLKGSTIDKLKERLFQIRPYIREQWSRNESIAIEAELERRKQMDPGTKVNMIWMERVDKDNIYSFLLDKELDAIVDTFQYAQDGSKEKDYYTKANNEMRRRDRQKLKQRIKDLKDCPYHDENIEKKIEELETKIHQGLQPRNYQSDEDALQRFNIARANNNYNMLFPYELEHLLKLFKERKQDHLVNLIENVFIERSMAYKKKTTEELAKLWVIKKDRFAFAELESRDKLKEVKDRVYESAFTEKTFQETNRQNEVPSTKKSKDYITTISNQQVHFLNPDPKEILLSDIFYHLARMPRFTCATKQRYSVGQHSLHVAEQLPGNIALVGLLHDAAEYIFNDLASPIVAHCESYKVLRDKFQNEIYLKFLPRKLYDQIHTKELYDQVKKVDTDMCATEQKWLKNHSPTAGQVIQGVAIPVMKPKQVELKLHKAYHKYLELANG